MLGIDKNRLNKAEEDLCTQLRNSRNYTSIGGESNVNQNAHEDNNNIDVLGVVADLTRNNNIDVSELAADLTSNNNIVASGIAVDLRTNNDDNNGAPGMAGNDKEDENDDEEIGTKNDDKQSSDSEESKNGDAAPVVASTKKKRERNFSYIYLVWSDFMDFVKVGSSHASAARFRWRYKTVSKLNT